MSKQKGRRQLLIQTFPLNQGFSVQRLHESIRQEDGKIYLKGIIQRAEVPNGNGRIYPKKVLQQQITRYMQLVKNNMAVGQRDHPENDVLSIANISHLIKKIWWEGNDVWGEFQITSNSIGKDIVALIKDGVVLATSSRALGSLHRVDEHDIVQDDLEIIGWDLVVTPSTKGAYFRKYQQDTIDEKIQNLKLIKQNQTVNVKKDIMKQILINLKEKR